MRWAIRPRLRARRASSSPAARSRSPRPVRRARRSRCSLGVPVLGICYGMQTMAAQLGGAVEAGRPREFGYAEVRAHGHTACSTASRTTSTPRARPARCVDEPRRPRHALPPGLQAHRATADVPIAAWPTRRALLRLQFHPEVTHTKQGSASAPLRARHLRLRRAVDPGNIIDDAIARVRSRWAATRCCSACPAASIPPWSRRCCTGPSATSSPACSSTTACCACTKATR
jgi:GMP synthase-like glutamine amidotransferase